MFHAVETSGAWAGHRADVTARAVEAFMELLDTPTGRGVSMPAVAERAGISVRTLYRYFPTKEELRRAASAWMDRSTRAAMAGRRLDLEVLPEYLAMLWKELGAEIPAVRTQHATAEGRALRAARLPAH